jgi:general secretion pathway protein L
MAVRDLNLPAIGPRLSELARRSGLAGFWPWWTAQLNAMVPPKPRAALERRRMRPVLVFDGDHATLWRPGMEGERAVMAPAATIPLVGDAATVAGAGRAAMASLAVGSYGAAAVTPKVLLSIPARDVLRKTLTLPAAVEPNLRQTLVYDLDRHTPFKPEEIYFDATVVGRSPEKKEIRVDLVSCRKAVVDAAMRHIAAWGAAVSAAVPDPPATAAASRLNLLPHESRPSLAVWMRWQFWLPLALVAAVALAAIAIPLWQKRDYAIALNGLAAEARAQAKISDALRTELETKVGDYNFALDKKYAYPSAFRVVDEVSRVLPDDTWLTQMELKTIAKGKETQREILVRGETANAGRLVQLVEESQLFAQTAPRSPTTKIQPGPGEIFDLGAQVKPLAAPSQVALLGSEKPTDAAVTPASTAAMPTAPAATAPALTTGTATDAPPALAPAAAPALTPAAVPAATGTTGTAPAAPAPAVAAPPAVATQPLPKPAGAPLAPVAPAAAPRATVPTAGAPDPWVSAPSTAPAPRPARAPVMLAPPPSSSNAASGSGGGSSNNMPTGAKP